MLNRSLNNALKHSFLYQVFKSRRDRKALQDWERSGRPAPPPHVIKEGVLKEYAEKFRTRVLIETGTYLGEMIDAMKDSFDRIFSIELDRALYEQATRRFDADDHISIVHGDSGESLKELLASIDEPCLFWLDGHFSGGVTAKATLETPIMREMEHILAHPLTGHVVLIDDARLFTGANDYPTVQELSDLISRRRPHWQLTLENDIIRIHEPERR
jgi:hypothetical protein